MRNIFIVLALFFSSNIALADYLNLSASANAGSPTVIGLSWDGVSGRTYKVEWKKSSAGMFSWNSNNIKVGNVQVGSDDRWYYDVGNLTCDTSYKFRVKMKGKGWRNQSASTRGCGSTPCPQGGWFDSANCQIGKAPNGTTAFIWGGNYYYSTLPGNQCPYTGSYFDGANCFVQAIPSGVQPFIYANHWYYKSFP